MARDANGHSADRGRNRLRSVARPRRAGAGPAPAQSPSRGQGGMSDRGRDREVGISDLGRLSRSALRALWVQELRGQPPATLGRDVLALGIAYAKQERRLGGLSKPVVKEMARLFDQVLRGDRTEMPTAFAGSPPRRAGALARGGP